MHYYIDGYNLIFRSFGDSKDLKVRRQHFIEKINDRVEGINLTITIVFDSQYQGGEGTRAHFYNLEIVFTEKNETADELILKIVKSKENPQDVVVVTSDKQLALSVRRHAAKVETGEHFLKWLESKKIKKEKAPEIQPSKVKKSKIQKEIEQKHKLAAKPEECFEYYLEHFGKENEKILLSEAKKVTKKSKKEKAAIVKSKKPAKSSGEKGISDMERWLRLFET